MHGFFEYVQTSVAFTSLVIAAVPTLYVSCQTLCLILQYKVYFIWVSEQEKELSKEIIDSKWKLVY